MATHVLHLRKASGSDAVLLETLFFVCFVGNGRYLHVCELVLVTTVSLIVFICDIREPLLYGKHLRRLQELLGTFPIDHRRSGIR